MASTKKNSSCFVPGESVYNMSNAVFHKIDLLYRTDKTQHHFGELWRPSASALRTKILSTILFLQYSFGSGTHDQVSAFSEYKKYPEIAWGSTVKPQRS